MSQNASFFDDTGLPTNSILTRQVNPSAPSVAGLDNATSMLLADRLVEVRMAHFPDNLYDLRDDSHLMRFMRSLLGDSGVGQLRKRYAVAQFQNALSSTHFFDLDGFYGAIFGVSRFSSEVLPLNPNLDTATANEWDQVDNADSSFRDRISKLASAINLGATLPGIQAAAEGIIQAPVDVYETWRLMDTYGEGDSGNTWDDIEDLGPTLPTTWDELEGQPWTLLDDGFLIGRTGTNSRSEVVIHPRKDYDEIAERYGSAAALRQQAEDSSALVRVLSVLKPAGVLLTVDTDSLSRFEQIPVTRLHADSNYWEVVSQVTPRADLLLPSGIEPYPLSPQQVEAGLPSNSTRSLPRPPWSSHETSDWSYASEIVSVVSYTLDDDGSQVGQANDESITYLDGQRDTFEALRSVMDVRRSLAGRYSAEGVLTAHPYSDNRTEVVTHG